MKINLANIKKAKNLLKKSECIAIPTETVYGLAGNAYSDYACKKIFKFSKISGMIDMMSPMKSANGEDVFLCL